MFFKQKIKELLTTSSSNSDSGAWQFRALEVRRIILNSILNLTGTQCREANINKHDLILILVSTRSTILNELEGL